MATNSNILAWRISWTEEPGRLLSTGWQRVTHEWNDLTCMHAVICAQRMGTIKDRNGMDLTEAEDIKKRWQEYTEEPYKKDIHDPDNHNGVITHLEPDMLEYKVQCVLGSITTNKASEGDGIPAEIFQVLKDDSVKVLGNGGN